MEVNGTAQNNDESNFSGNQTLEPSDDQGSMMVSNESQNVSGDSAFSVSDSSSNVNNTLAFGFWMLLAEYAAAFDKSPLPTSSDPIA